MRLAGAQRHALCPDEAVAMLDLRCVYLDGPRKDFMALGIVSENAHLYPNAPAAARFNDW